MHRLLATSAADIIHAVFEQRKVLDHSLAKAFQANPKWGKRDRNFVAETVFEVVRWRRALAFLAQDESTPALCAAQWTRMGYDLPEWWQYDGSDAETIKAREAELAEQPRAVRESIPDWLDALGSEELGESWDAELAALNQRAPVYLRVNTLKTSPAEAIDWLASYHIPAHEVSELPNTLVLNPGKTLPKSLRLDGRVEIQDAGSQMIAPLLEPQANECIIDTCAGAGGKSLHLAALMRGKGKIVAMDIVPKKLQELQRRAKRARATRTIETQLINPEAIATYESIADRVLIDAPCSGLGTLKRQPDLKWRIKPATIQRMRGIQQECLQNYSTMLKPGGRLVYATCSILPSENRQNVDHFLNNAPFKLIKECPVSPAATGYDGFYAAVLEKLPTS
ncbi:RsmB/NOP family class I SAM-dependent RNA methyltransferase [Rubritalea spongiae]|uniref:RsmB/NOP family class I SAM-dependent RNA methyltransferase n=1 Tax=Rubritalea spongiae TaxID=430797 RepID=A0ABW5E1G9_9BACT